MEGCGGGRGRLARRKRETVPQHGPPKPLQNTHTHAFQTEVINIRAFDFHMQKPRTDMPPLPLEYAVCCGAAV